MKVGTRNRLEGEVIQIKCGTVMCLVKVRLPGGAEMESVVTRDSFDAMGIQSGDTVQLAVSALNVLLLKE
jgi:molybdopterin-binding protein